MPKITPNTTKARMARGDVALGFGVSHLHTVATPGLAAAAGFDWLFLDTEHGALSVSEVTQICIAALPTGVTPIVRVCRGALDEATRALDNGALGIVVPHVDTVEDAREVARALRYPPLGTRSWGGPHPVFGFRPPPAAEAQAAANAEILVVAMIETAGAVEAASAIAAVDGIDVLLIGASDLSADMGIAGQVGHPKLAAAFETVGAACTASGKILGMGGIYDEEVAPRFIAGGARFVLAGSDGNFLLAGATARASFLRRAAS